MAEAAQVLPDAGSVGCFDAARTAAAEAALVHRLPHAVPDPD